MKKGITEHTSIRKVPKEYKKHTSTLKRVMTKEYKVPILMVLGILGIMMNKESRGA